MWGQVLRERREREREAERDRSACAAHGRTVIYGCTEYTAVSIALARTPQTYPAAPHCTPAHAHTPETHAHVLGASECSNRAGHTDFSRPVQCGRAAIRGRARAPGTHLDGPQVERGALAGAAVHVRCVLPP